MDILCPNCQCPIQLDEVNTRQEISCSTCGGSFRLEQESTLRWSYRESARLGRFELLEPVRVGAFGIVYRALDPELDRTVAIKVPRGSSLPGAHELERFLREARSVAQLRHPSIVTVHEAGQIGNVPYLVCDFVEGLTLADLLSSRRPTPREAAQLLVNLAHALQYAHERGVIHRDIKPSNIMLEVATPAAARVETTAFHAGTPRLMDFGLAKREAGEMTVTLDGQVLGTPAYMSPEQARGESHTVDGRTDIYSLGVVLYQMLTGELPFRGTTRMLLHQVLHDDPRPPRKLNDHIPRDLETICLKAMAKEAARRYQTAKELSDDLERFLRGDPIRARPVGQLERLWRWCRRNRAVATLMTSTAALLLCLALGTLTAAVLWREQRNAALVNLGRAVRAEKDRSEKLWGAYLAQARAARWSGRAGRRFESLQALGKAAELLPILELSHEEHDKRRLVLRNEAIASLALVDIRPGPWWEGNPSGTTVLVFDRSVERYARSNEKGDITIAKVPNNELIATLPGPGLPALALKFSPDRQWLGVKYGSDRMSQFKVWDITRAEVVLEISKGIDHYAFDFSPDGPLLAAGQENGDILLYELSTRKLSRRLHDGPAPHSLAFHPQGKQLAVSSLVSNVVQIRDAQSGKVVASLKHPSAARGLAWRDDGWQLAAACADSRVYVWNLVSPPRLQATLEGHGHVTVHVAFNRRGDLLASSGWDTMVRLWDPLAGHQLVSTPGLVWDLRFSPDDRRLVPAIDGSRLSYWEVAPSQTFRTLYPGQTKKVTFVDFSPDGRLLACADQTGTQFWDLAVGKQVGFLAAGNAAALFHPDKKSLFTSGDLGLFRWPIRQGSATTWQIGPPQRLSQHPHELASLSREGQFLVARAGIRALGIDLAKPDKPVFFDGHPNPRFVAVSPDGRWVATGTWHGTGVKIWDASTGKLLHELPAHSSATVAFSPDGQWLVSSTGEDVRIWETATWQPRHRILRDRGGDLPGFLAFAPQADLLAIAHSLSVIQLIDPSTGRQIATLESPRPRNISWMCFHPNGSLLAVATDNLIHLWDLRLIRKQLADMNLDWDLPPYPEPEDGAANSPAPFQMTMDVGELALATWPANANAQELIAQYSAALRNKPDDAMLCNNLAWLLATGPENLRDIKRAVTLAERAVNLAPQQWTFQNTLGVAYYRSSRYQDAIGALEASLKASDGQSAAFDLYFLAMCHHRLGNAAKAKECFDRAVQWVEQHLDRLALEDQQELKAFEAEAKAVLTPK